jgi:hypothetical protein
MRDGAIWAWRGEKEERKKERGSEELEVREGTDGSMGGGEREREGERENERERERERERASERESESEREREKAREKDGPTDRPGMIEESERERGRPSLFDGTIASSHTCVRMHARVFACACARARACVQCVCACV